MYFFRIGLPIIILKLHKSIITRTKKRGTQGEGGYKVLSFQLFLQSAVIKSYKPLGRRNPTTFVIFKRVSLRIGCKSGAVKRNGVEISGFTSNDRNCRMKMKHCSMQCAFQHLTNVIVTKILFHFIINGIENIAETTWQLNVTQNV